MHLKFTTWWVLTNEYCHISTTIIEITNHSYHAKTCFLQPISVPGNHSSALCDYSLAFSRISYTWDYTLSCFYIWFLLLGLIFFLISHQFYTHQCIHVNPNHPIQHTTIPTPPRFSPLGVHTFHNYYLLAFLFNICFQTRLRRAETGSLAPHCLYLCF